MTGATILEPRGGGLRWEEKEKKKVTLEILMNYILGLALGSVET